MAAITRAFQAVRSEARWRAQAPKMLLVMGMHRSGTSCVTRVLNLMGASLGPVSGQWEPGSDELHWESSEANWINDEILGRTDGSWDRPPAQVRARARDYARCRQLLWQFSGARTAALKDPRMMLTYPVWRPMLPEHAFVVCVRHPIDVARSLQKRNGMPLERGVALWRTYNERLLADLPAGGDVHWVDFDEGATGVRRLIGHMNGKWGLAETPEALGHYDAGAHHHRCTDELPSDVAAVYRVMLTRAKGQALC